MLKEFFELYGIPALSKEATSSAVSSKSPARRYCSMRSLEVDEVNTTALRTVHQNRSPP